MAKFISRTNILPIIPGRFPLQHPDLRINEIPLTGIIRIQGNNRCPEFNSAVKDATGFNLPKNDQVFITEDRRLTQIAPNEWLLFIPLEDEQSQLRAIMDSFNGLFANATIISDSRVTLRIIGKTSSELLSKGSALDFYPESFPTGRMRSTRFAGIAVFIEHSNANEYRLYVDISFANFIQNWLCDAAEEFRANSNIEIS